MIAIVNYLKDITWTLSLGHHLTPERCIRDDYRLCIDPKSGCRINQNEDAEVGFVEDESLGRCMEGWRHERPEGMARGRICTHLDFGYVLLNVLIILVFNKKWLWNYQNDLKVVKHIKISTLSAVILLFSAALLVFVLPIKSINQSINKSIKSSFIWEKTLLTQTQEGCTIE